MCQRRYGEMKRGAKLILPASAFMVIVLLSCHKTFTEDPDNNAIVVTPVKGYSEILGRPTDNSVTLSLMFDSDKEAYLEYGTVKGTYPFKTATVPLAANTPAEIELAGLIPDTRYYYRTLYRTSGQQVVYEQSLEHTFHTRRITGSTFTFTVESDEHLYDKKGNRTIYQVCLANQALDNPDFMLSLGDIFGDDHNPLTITSTQIDQLHLQYRPYLGTICHSVPIFICLGNHEGENDYYLNLTPPENLAVKSTLSRKKYYPNPIPGSFYSGNTASEPYGIGNPENYYSWTWGDALFVVLDVYRYENETSPKPQNWDWTLGNEQYAWLKETLEKSTSKYKFVFAHHIRGQGRGGVTNARLFEWGGYEQDGITWGFSSNRPGWAKPVHKLFVDTGVNIFFQGHDHVFSHETLDGVTYQSLPMPSDSTYQIGYLANADAYTTDVLPGTGHIKVTVSPAGIKVDFIKAVLPADETASSQNRATAFTYNLTSKK
jgi:hypothetical protein